MKTRKWLLFSFATLSFLIPFIVYFFTTNPYLSFTDNGELMAVCVTLGVAHPTGYPLFTILGHLWSLLPLCSSKIFQMNLFAAFWVALASLVFFFTSFSLVRILKKYAGSNIKKSIPIEDGSLGVYLLALIAALSFAFGREIWSQATSLEVYPLQLFIFVLIFLLSFEIIRSNFHPTLLYLLFFTLGLGFSNHLSTVLIVPSILFLIFFRQDEKIFFVKPSPKSLATLILPFLVGISPYLYLLIRSSQFPIFNWGWVSRSFDKFLYHVSGKQYRVWMFSSAETLPINFKKFITDLPFEFAYVGLFVVTIGLIYLFFRQRYILIYLILAFVFCLLYSLNYQIHDIETYFSLAFIALFLFFVAGLYFLWSKFKEISFVFILIPIVSVFLNFKENDQSKNNLVTTYTKNVLDNLAPNAIILSAQWDYFCSAFWYLQQVEGYRRDVVLIEKELLRRTWYLEQLRRWYPQVINKSKLEMEKFLEQLELFESDKQYDPSEIQFRFENLLRSFVGKNIDERPVYITLDLLQNEYDARPFLEFEQVPQGFAIRLLKEFEPLETDLSKINIEPFAKFRNNKHHLVQGIIQAVSVNLVYLENYFRLQGMNEKSAEILKLIEKLQR